MTLLTIEERGGGAHAGTSLPWLALGFRPFYLLAALFAAIAVPAWVARLAGWLDLANIDLAWHVHEMLFGFVLAVIVGFLYTAGRNWTGLWTPRGAALGALAALWVAGRVAMLAAPPLLSTLVDGAFLPAATLPLYLVLKRSGNKRNMFLVGLLTLLTLANLAFHAARLQWLALSPLQPAYAALAIVIVIEAVIGGRVIPNFTANALGVLPVMHEKRDRIALGFTAAAALAWIFGAPAPFAASLALCAALCQSLRLFGWLPWRTAANPLLWILHVSYAWIPLGFFMLALAELDMAPLTAAVHLLAVGATGGLIIGMITRTALGHTGRRLAAGRSETAMYALLQLGVLLRLAAALNLFGLRDFCLAGSATLWSLAFLLYCAVYAPYLWRPRADGREG